MGLADWKDWAAYFYLKADSTLWMRYLTLLLFAIHMQINYLQWREHLKNVMTTCQDYMHTIELSLSTQVNQMHSLWITNRSCMLAFFFRTLNFCVLFWSHLWQPSLCLLGTRWEAISRKFPLKSARCNRVWRNYRSFFSDNVTALQVGFLKIVSSYKLTCIVSFLLQYEFYHLEMFTAMSIVQVECGLPILHATVYDYFVSGKCTETSVHASGIPEPHLRVGSHGGYCIIDSGSKLIYLFKVVSAKHSDELQAIL